MNQSIHMLIIVIRNAGEPPASGYGAECTEPLTETQDCNTQLCQPCIINGWVYRQNEIVTNGECQYR